MSVFFMLRKKRKKWNCCAREHVNCFCCNWDTIFDLFLLLLLRPMATKRKFSMFSHEQFNTHFDWFLLLKNSHVIPHCSQSLKSLKTTSKKIKNTRIDISIQVYTFDKMNEKVNGYSVYLHSLHEAKCIIQEAYYHPQI